jgi:hypothetical protein
MTHGRILLAIVMCSAFSPVPLLRAQDYLARTVTIVHPFAPNTGELQAYVKLETARWGKVACDAEVARSQ